MPVMSMVLLTSDSVDPKTGTAQLPGPAYKQRLHKSPHMHIGGVCWQYCDESNGLFFLDGRESGIFAMSVYSAFDPLHQPNPQPGCCVCNPHRYTSGTPAHRLYIR